MQYVIHHSGHSVPWNGSVYQNSQNTIAWRVYGVLIKPFYDNKADALVHASMLMSCYPHLDLIVSPRKTTQDVFELLGIIYANEESEDQ